MCTGRESYFVDKQTNINKLYYKYPSQQAQTFRVSCFLCSYTVITYIEKENVFFFLVGLIGFSA